MEFLHYNTVDKSKETDYPNWGKATPNLETYLTALNLSQPIIGSQFELVYSRWPRTIFFAKNINIPGIMVNTLDINHAGFTIPISTHVKYESNELTLSILADKEGFHYYDWRNMVLQSGHPLIAGDTRSMIGSTKHDSDEDQLKIRLRNKLSDYTHHYWIVHNYRPTAIGDIELSHDNESFVEFEITGTFTHITYCTGRMARVEMQNKTNINEDNLLLGNPPDAKKNSSETEQKKDDNPPSEKTETETEIPYVDPKGPTNPEFAEQYAKMANGEGNQFIADSQVDIVSDDQSSHIYATTENYISLQNSDDGTPPSQEERNMAKKYQEQLNAQNDEVKKKLQEISQMKPDPNFKPEKFEKEYNLNGDLTRQGQTKDQDNPEKTDRYAGTIIYGGTFSSQAQKEAFEKLMDEHKDKTVAINRAYKEEKANLGKKQ